jgi:hypothetical protein
MGFFNFSSKSNDSNKPADKPVILQLNEEEVIVDAGVIGERTVAELFEDFGDALGDTHRATRYVASGQIVDGSTRAVAGTIYRAAITSETKG